jgi:hypothetical protein
MLKVQCSIVHELVPTCRDDSLVALDVNPGYGMATKKFPRHAVSFPMKY